MKRLLMFGLLLVVAVFLIFVVIYWTDSAHWFLRYTGADAESGNLVRLLVWIRWGDS